MFFVFVNGTESNCHLDRRLWMMSDVVVDDDTRTRLLLDGSSIAIGVDGGGLSPWSDVEEGRSFGCLGGAEHHG